MVQQPMATGLPATKKTRYEKIVAAGSEKYADTRYCKIYLIQNQVMVIATLATFMLSLITAGFNVYYLWVGAWSPIYLTPVIANLVLPLTFIALFYVRMRCQNELTNELALLAAFTAASLYLLVMTATLGPVSKFYLAAFAVMPLPFFLFTTARRWIFVTAIIIPTFSLFAGYMTARSEMFVLPLIPTHYVIIEFMVMALTPAVLLASCYYIWKQSNIAEEKLQAERDRSESLLLNILPKDVAHELKEHGKSSPTHFESVSVMFTDFVGFTGISENMSASELIQELDLCFSYFDNVTKRYNLEKIKTIGDSYMLAGGLPRANRTHAIDCILAGLEIQAFMDQMREIKHAQNLPYWELRLGINTGPIVAGVIGEMKFAYDVFGDTVNTASRMESSGLPGKINISRATYEMVKDLFACEYRGKLMAKNKGMVEMYWVSGLKPEYSVQAEGRVPNETFREKYAQL